MCPLISPLAVAGLRPRSPAHWNGFQSFAHFFCQDFTWYAHHAPLYLLLSLPLKDGWPHEDLWLETYLLSSEVILIHSHVIIRCSRSHLIRPTVINIIYSVFLLNHEHSHCPSVVAWLHHGFKCGRTISSTKKGERDIGPFVLSIPS